MNNFNHCESLYWVFTQLCNDECRHCYNFSGPRGERISEEECMQIIGNLPESIDRLILSGGEPLAERHKLYAILDRLRERYGGTATQVMLQTNGDLLNEERLDTLIEKGVVRFDIASFDRYHKQEGRHIERLSRLFESRGVYGDDQEPLTDKKHYLGRRLSWGYWGANENFWLGGNWARGRALENGIWKQDPEHNFCAIHSGARNFLGGYSDIPQEISIQLWRINPCCAGTRFPLGDARHEKVAEVLALAASSPVFQKLNEGNPLAMGEHLGVSKAEARQHTRELQNICLYCDSFFERYLQELRPPGAMIELPVLNNK